MTEDCEPSAMPVAASPLPERPAAAASDHAEPGGRAGVAHVPGAAADMAIRDMGGLVRDDRLHLSARFPVSGSCPN